MFNKKFGVEIEAYGIERSKVAELLREVQLDCRTTAYTHNTTSYWKVVTDASLYGDNPFELVSPVLQGETGLQQLTTALRAIEQLARINRSCGLHVHYDVSGWNDSQFELTTDNYRTLEPLIDLFLPRSRRADNNYQFCRSLVGDSYEEIQHSRFYKVNLQSVQRHGTIEFRQHSGTVEYKKVLHWIALTSKIMDLTLADRRIPTGLALTDYWDILMEPSENQVFSNLLPIPRTLSEIKQEVYSILGLQNDARLNSIEVRRYADLHGLADRADASLLTKRGWLEVLNHLRRRFNTTSVTLPALDKQYWRERLELLNINAPDLGATRLIDYLNSTTNTRSIAC